LKNNTAIGHNIQDFCERELITAGKSAGEHNACWAGALDGDEGGLEYLDVGDSMRWAGCYGDRIGD
jgi:hypothetical protein